MRLIAVGKMGQGPEAALFARYAGRLQPALAVVEVREAQGASAAEVRRREGETVLEALKPGVVVVALDARGELLSSEALSSRLGGWRAADFVIGGAEGLDDAVLARAQARLSFGPMIWPHKLARIMLAEQLYRGQCVLRRHPYHRQG